MIDNTIDKTAITKKTSICLKMSTLNAISNNLISNITKKIKLIIPAYLY